MAIVTKTLKVVLYLFTILLLVALLLLIVDNFVLTKTESPTHSEKTAQLRLLDGQTTDGWVRIKANDMEFRARVANLDKKNSEPVILLHGWPATSEMWNPLVEKLTEHGYRVLAFDQRGYSPGARPSEQKNYAMEKLVGDLHAVADAVGFKKFHLITHDWGASVGWNAVQPGQDRVASFTAMAVPHINSFEDELAVKGSEQRKRSSYMLLFRTPFVAERVLLFNNGYILRTAVYKSMTPEVRDFQVQVFLEPGAMTAALNWYRENLRAGRTKRLEPVTVPTLYMWGKRDVAVARETAEGGEKYMKGPYRFVELDTSHWMIEEDPDQVVSEVIKHIKQYPVNKD